MKKIMLLLFLIPSISFSQDCSCQDHYNWVKKTFEENDAGFDFAIENRGKEAYVQHNKRFEEKVKTIKNLPECTSALYQWLKFFRSGHIAIKTKNQVNRNGTRSDKKLTDQEIIEQYKEWEKFPFELETFKKYLSTLKTPGFEGIWKSHPYTIGIKKVNNEYIGFIIEAENVPQWQKEQIKLKILNANQENFEAIFYLRNHAERKITQYEFIGKNYLNLGSFNLERIYPKFKIEKEVKEYFDHLATEEPTIKELDKNTLLLTIPSFSFSEKKKIDSVLSANHKKIITTKNLIIDVRDNGGGSDSSYEKIIPYLYTNPIYTVGVEYLSTSLNNSRMNKFINDPDWTARDKKWARNGLKKLNKNLGKFINLSDDIISVEKHNTIYPYPKNVAIVINDGNGSTTEQFLLAVKQSKKVKLFGTTTRGVLDISNMHFVEAPCEDFELGYCLTRSMRIPEMAIDDKGIQPDYYIHKSTPEYLWISHIHKILKE